MLNEAGPECFIWASISYLGVGRDSQGGLSTTRYIDMGCAGQKEGPGQVFLKIPRQLKVGAEAWMGSGTEHGGGLTVSVCGGRALKRETRLILYLQFGLHLDRIYHRAIVG